MLIRFTSVSSSFVIMSFNLTSIHSESGTQIRKFDIRRNISNGNIQKSIDWGKWIVWDDLTVLCVWSTLFYDDT